MLRRLQIRENSPLVIASLALGVVILIWLGMYPLSSYLPQRGESVVYWLVIMLHNSQNFVAVLAISLIAIVLSMFLSAESKTFWVIALVLIANICTVCACFSGFFFANEKTSVVHIQSINFESDIYRLMHGQSSRDFGVENWASYILFRCDSLGIYCIPINEFNDYVGNPSVQGEHASLEVDTASNILYIHFNDGRPTERLPATG